MKRWVVGCLCILSVLGYSEVTTSKNLKEIRVPATMTTEIKVSNELGFLNGKYDVRARLFNLDTRERLWYQDFKKVLITEGSMVLNMNSVGDQIDAEDFHYDNLSFVITLDDHSLELPILTDFYSYRSLFSEFAWDTRFRDVLSVDRSKNYVAIGRVDTIPKAHLDVGGAIKIGYEDTEVTGSIRLNKAGDMLQVRHPDKWVDLIYTDDSFVRSRWNINEHLNSIYLASPNFSVGIATSNPIAALGVDGDVWGDGELHVGDMRADSIYINGMDLSSSGEIKLAGLELTDSIISWDASGFNLGNSFIFGDGEDLTNLGGVPDAFVSGMIQSQHLVTHSVLQDHFNLFSGGVFTSRNIIDNSVSMDRFVEHVFDGSFIGANSIVSSNLLDYMFSYHHFDANLQSLLNNQVPDGYITYASNIMATNSVLAGNFLPNSFSSNYLVSNMFNASSFGADVINGGHITHNAILSEHFKTNTIDATMLNGILSVDQGGTGINFVALRRLVSYNGGFSFPKSVLVSDNGYLHIASSEVQSSQISDYPLWLSSTGNALVNVQHVGDYSIPVIAFNLGGASANIRVDDSGGYIYFGDNIAGFGVKKYGGVFFGDHTFSSTPVKLNLNGSITIATANSSNPEVGTIEYRSADDTFRFFGESGWMYAYSGFGVGDPINVVSTLDLNDTYLGQSEHSYVRATASMITDTDDAHVQVQEASLRGIVSSTVRGQRMDLDHIMGATVDGDSIVGGQVSRSHVRAESAHVRQVSDSFLQGAGFTGQQIQRSKVMAQDAEVVQVQGATIDASNSVVRGVRDVTVDVIDSTVVGVTDTDITGQGLDVRQVQDSVIVADGSRVAQVQGATIQGAGHTILNAQLAQVQGNRNVVMASDGADVMGDDNRVFGDDQWIRGDSNTVFGRDIKVEGQNNIVFHAGNDPLQVVGDEQIVLSAPNGIHIATGPDMVVSATEMGGGWSMVSDRTLKTNFASVDYKSVFDKLMGLPITEWEYTFNKGVRHIGPMAQDFKQAFGLGSDERFITATDADGVAYAAIKHLISELDNLPKVTPANVATRLDGLQRVLDETEAVLDAVDESLALKKSALDVIADRNFEQYKLLDKQFKGLAKLPPAPTWWWIAWRIGVILSIFFIGIAIGFWGIKRYYNRG